MTVCSCRGIWGNCNCIWVALPVSAVLAAFLKRKARATSKGRHEMGSRKACHLLFALQAALTFDVPFGASLEQGCVIQF